MRFNTIIMGAGLSGLTAGLSLQQAGQKVAIMAGGQCRLHFSGGSFDLLGYDGQGQPVSNPVEAIAALDANHPYKKVADVAALASQAQQLLAQCGIATTGTATRNHWRLTPVGLTRPTWLTIDGMVALDAPGQFPYKKVALMNMDGYLDFPTDYLALGLKQMGVEVSEGTIDLPELNEARRSPSEMRASNIARRLASVDVTARLAAEINQKAGQGTQAVLLPAVLGLQSGEQTAALREQVQLPVQFVATLPPSVPGVRVLTALRRHFIAAGGVFMQDNKVTGGKIDGGRVACLTAEKLPDEALVADNYVLATGSFMSGGLVANFKDVVEPVLHLDVDHSGDRAQWSRLNVYDDQPYMHFGVATDAQLHPLKGGQPVANMQAIGSVLSGQNSVKQACAEGVDMLTALQAVNNILKH